MTAAGLPQHMRSARQVTLLEVVVREGEGTVSDISREVTYYYLPDGTFVAKNDPVPGGNPDTLAKTTSDGGPGA